MIVNLMRICVLVLFMGSCKSTNKPSNKESFAKEDKSLSSEEFMIADYSAYTREHTLLGIRANFLDDNVHKVDICHDSLCETLEQTSFMLFSPEKKVDGISVILKKCIQGVCTEYKKYQYPTREMLSEEKTQEIKSINKYVNKRYKHACYYEQIDSVSQAEAETELDYLIKKNEQIENSNPLLYQLIFYDRLLHSIFIRASMFDSSREKEQLSLTRESRSSVPEIKWYPQSHYRPEIAYDAETFRSQYDIYVDLKKSVKRLPRDKIVLFDEGRVIGEAGKQISIFDQSTVDELTRKMKNPRFKQDQLSSREKAIFVKYGAGHFIKSSYPNNIVLKGTEKLEENLVASSALARSLRNQENGFLRRLVIEVNDLLTSAYLLYNNIDPWKIEPDYYYSVGILEREKIALEEIRKHLQLHPTDDVRLLYGGGHSFEEWKFFPLNIERIKQRSSLESNFKESIQYKAEHGKIPIAHQYAFDTKITNNYDQLSKIRQTQSNFSRRIKFRFVPNQSQECEGVDEKILKSIKIVFE